MDHHTHTHRLH